LWTAYTLGDRVNGARFATETVVDALFSTPYSGEAGMFEGCRPRKPGLFDCEYDQPSTRYAMTAQADGAGSFTIVELTSGALEPTASPSG
jgi:hypothetical protein